MELRKEFRAGMKKIFQDLLIKEAKSNFSIFAQLHSVRNVEHFYTMSGMWSTFTRCPDCGALLHDVRTVEHFYTPSGIDYFRIATTFKPGQSILWSPQQDKTSRRRDLFLHRAVDEKDPTIQRQCPIRRLPLEGSRGLITTLVINHPSLAQAPESFRDLHFGSLITTTKQKWGSE